MLDPDRPQITAQYGPCPLNGTSTHSDYLLLIFFHGNNGYPKAP